MNNIELLVPVGDFDCLKAAVQNGADAVYLGSSDFNARNSATNFDINELEKAINYAHVRNVKVHLTLNTLIKNNEFEDALKLAKDAYELGIDAIIVQDLGLANFLIAHFPGLPIHASTQMTCHNLAGAKYLENLGIQRIVLARELSLDQIAYIKSNISTEIEVFTHGALCISYSGQCLYSSLIGGRSGNRGKCAQGCRLPYELLENDKVIDKGYLLSPRDLCSLELLPELLRTNIDSLKIEGRMKSPEYVATVARVYRKYLDKIINCEKYIIEEQDKKDLLQVFNRGNFSIGHLTDAPNKDLIFKEKPSNIGIYLGKVSNYNPHKGHITLVLKDVVEIGDTITFENEPTTYKVSELMIGNQNIVNTNISDKVTIGRMKGNIHVGDKLYKLSSKVLSQQAISSYSIENKKMPLNCELDVHLNKPIELKVFDKNGITLTVTSDIICKAATNLPTTKERIKTQLEKTGNTPFYFKTIEINMDNNLYLPISKINELRRNALQEYENQFINQFKRTCNLDYLDDMHSHHLHNSHQVCLLLNILHREYDYQNLNYESIDKIYIPFKYFADENYQETIHTLSKYSNIYMYMPIVMKSNLPNLFKSVIAKSLNKFAIKGFVISNIGYFELLKEYKNDYEFIANYSMNVFNNHTIDSLACNVVTISPELNKEEINNISENTKNNTELIVYGNIPVMTSNYCLFGTANKCHSDCTQKCKNENNKYYLKDRMNFKFRIIPDPMQTITTIYNSKTNSIDTHDITIDNLRIDILDESINEINHIVATVKEHNKLEGKDYTNGNLNRIV